MVNDYIKLNSLIYILTGINPKIVNNIGIALKAVLAGHEASKVTDKEELDEAIEFTGYSYDPEQDIFYSTLEPWQRKYGYCHLYDELSAPWGMIMDCEPMFFEYDNKKWMISVWKGQYDLTTGCEIGIYTKEEPKLKLTEFLTGTFYNCAADEDMLEMSYTLRKNGETMLTREDVHWWLTGFKLGEYTEPSELTMEVNITFKNSRMAQAYVDALKRAGYLEDDITVEGSKVSFIFDEPHTPQPLTRYKPFERLIQWKNKLMCDTYQEVTEGYNDINDKLNAIKEQEPKLYKKIMHLRKMNKLFDIHEFIEGYLH